MSYIQNLDIEKLPLKIGHKYTLLAINEMAFCYKMEFVLMDVVSYGDYAQYKNITALHFKEKGKRKIYQFFLKDSMVFLNGWDLNIKLENETSHFRVDALINLLSDDAESLRNLIKDKYVYGELGVLFYRNELNFDDIKPLFNDDALKIAYKHAVIRTNLKIKDDEVLN